MCGTSSFISDIGMNEALGDANYFVRIHIRHQSSGEYLFYAFLISHSPLNHRLSGSVARTILCRHSVVG